ncbi:MAG: 50S ribosomal protein L25 [Planctomycetota bacterium]|jgi:large subunit ribosomal protein L25
MAEVLNVELRTSLGKRNNRRLRAAGSVPAVLYGHGREAVSLAVSTELIDAAVRHGTRLVELSGAVSEQAFIRELQWDTWGTHILHVDFTRISAHEKVTVEVSVELRGEAPGVREGGVVEQLIHTIELECEASEIPEKIEVNVNNLEFNGSITADQIAPSEKVRILGAPDRVVVQCVAPMEVPEEEVAVAGEIEPEIIGRKPEEEGESE